VRSIFLTSPLFSFFLLFQCYHEVVQVNSSAQLGVKEWARAMPMMKHNSKSDAKGPETGKPINIVGFRKPSGICAGRHVKEFPSIQKRGGEKNPSEQVDIAMDSFGMQAFHVLDEKPCILEIPISRSRSRMNPVSPIPIQTSTNEKGREEPPCLQGVDQTPAVPLHAHPRDLAVVTCKPSFS
jgi:hypothetical protein